MIVTRISNKILNEDGQDVALDLLSIGREHCPSDKARPIESKDDVTDCTNSPRVCEKFGLKPLPAETISWVGRYFYVDLRRKPLHNQLGRKAMELLKRYMEQMTREMEIKESLESSKEPGTYLFPIDENSEAKIFEDPNGIHLFCVICNVPSKNSEEFLQHVLHGNLFGQGTLGATLGLDSTGRELTLSQDIEYNIGYEQFKEKLEDFLNTVEVWKDETAVFEKP